MSDDQKQSDLEETYSDGGIPVSYEEEEQQLPVFYIYTRTEQRHATLTAALDANVNLPKERTKFDRDECDPNKSEVIAITQKGAKGEDIQGELRNYALMHELLRGVGMNVIGTNAATATDAWTPNTRWLRGKPKTVVFKEGVFVAYDN